MHYNRGGEYLDLSHVLYNAFASDSALIFQQFMGMTARKRGGMSEIQHQMNERNILFINTGTIQ